MSTHAEQVSAAERAVIRAAIRFVGDGGPRRWRRLVDVVTDLEWLRATTCATCEGCGEMDPIITICGDGQMVDRVPCPAGCRDGRKP